MDGFGLITALAGGLVAFVCLIAAAGYVYQRLGLAKDLRRFPAPGRMIDIGGCRLHLDVRGEGWPIVVFESGIAATSLSWTLVQSEIAKITTTASYDRAWLGWSDPAKADRNLRQIVRELELLLERADVNGPIILVAHSYGALVARLYQTRRGANVAGMVLVDPIGTREWDAPSPANGKMLDRGIRLSRRGVWLARLGVVRLALRVLLSGGRRVPKLIARVSTGRDSWFTDRIVGQIRRLPAKLWPLIQAHWSNPKCFEGMAHYLETLPESSATVTQDAGPQALHAIPVIVLSAENAWPHERAEHEALAHDAHGRLEIVSNSGHWIQLDCADAVIGAITEMILRTRKGR